jgi:hypothetical protein
MLGFFAALHNVCFWHKADITQLSSNVRYWGKADMTYCKRRDIARRRRRGVRISRRMVRLSCEKCGRSGQYRKQKLIECYGADMRLPDLREEIARCRRNGQMHDACTVRYVDLVKAEFGR